MRGRDELAVNVPHDQLAARLAELPSGTDIVAYCRGRYCVFVPDAVRLLRARGIPARPLDGGLRGWPGCRSPPLQAHDPRRIRCAVIELSRINETMTCTSAETSLAVS